VHSLLKRKKAELALLYSIPILSNAKENSRLAGLLRRLQQQVLPYLQQLDKFTDQDLREITEQIFEWGKATGWLETNKSTGTLVSFCLNMIEESPIRYDEKIHRTLRNLAEHLEQGKALYPLSCTAGQIAAEKWERLYRKGV
jgi:hypothetical protein